MTKENSVSNRPLSVRSMLALVAVLAAIGAAAIQATGGSAATPPKSLHLVAHSLKKVGFFPKGKPRQGDRFGFGDTLTGDDTGFDRGVCTIVGGKSLCNIQVQLSRGTLSLQAFLPNGKPQNLPIPILGGTGDYDGATGTAIITQVSKNTTDVSVTLK
jgi:hypothetical protein